MVLILEDTVLAKSKEEELVRILEKILVERCGFSITLIVEYKEAITGKYEEDDELKIKMQVAEIYKRVNKETAVETLEISTNQENQTTKQPIKQPVRQPFKPMNSKKSDNPDVIYGRDFEEETIKIAEIIGEMG